MKVPLRYIVFNPTFILLGNSDRRKQVVKPVPCKSVSFYRGLHRLEKYLNIQDCLEKSLKIKLALKSTWKTLKGLEKSLNFTIYRRINTVFCGLNQY